jgi:ABC-2 type transport system permease protein
VGGLREDVFLPQTPLTAFSIGQLDLLPGKVTTNIWTARRALTRNYEVANPLNLLAGRFDLAFAVVFLFPLLILALSYNLLSAEREQGTLALVLSQPVRLSTVVLGKLVARFGLVVVLGAALTVVAALVAGVQLTAPGAAWRLTLWGAAVVLYGAFWFALAVLVGALGRSSAVNAVILASAWLLLVVVVPALVNALAVTLHPVPSRALLVEAMREASNGATQRGSQLLARYYQDHPELRPKGEDPDLNDFTTRYFTIERDVEQQVAPVLDRYDASLRAQQALVGRLRFLSPAIAVQEALNDIAGTGPVRQRSFLAQAWSFAEAKKGYFMPRVFRRERLAVGDLDALPRFAFADESAAELAERVGPGLAAVVLLVVVLGVAAWSRLRRFPATSG